MEHSGLHSVYGSPCSPGIQVQAAALFLSLQTALIPQGLGLHGSIISGLIDVAKNLRFLKKDVLMQNWSN